MDRIVAMVTTQMRHPRARIARAALGKENLDLSALEGLLAAHVHDLDSQAGQLSRASTGLLAMLLNDPSEQRADPTAVLDLIEKLSRLYSLQLGELRRTIDLAARLARPQSPSVRVLAAVKADNVEIGLPRGSDLGEVER